MYIYMHKHDSFKKRANNTYVQSFPRIGDQSYRLALNYIIDLKIARNNNTKQHITSVLMYCND